MTNDGAANTVRLMTRTRMAAIVLALPLVLAACGGGSSAKAELIDQLRQEAAGSGLPTEMVDCVVSALEGLSEDELMSILDDNASEATSEALAQAMVDCGDFE